MIAMKLQSLELLNWKSFARCKVELHPRVNLITGLNGSGKSNILDAILFALGAEPGRIMRAPNLQSLRRDGATREEETRVTLNFADGSQMRASVVLAGKGATAVYALNGRKVARKKVREWAAAAGLSVSGGWFVGQQNITAVPFAAPEQLAEKLCVAAGTSHVLRSFLAYEQEVTRWAQNRPRIMADMARLEEDIARARAGLAQDESERLLMVRIEAAEGTIMGERARSIARAASAQRAIRDAARTAKDTARSELARVLGTQRDSSALLAELRERTVPAAEASAAEAHARVAARL